MKEHPILFKGPMVRAILEGRKTQTRRVAIPRKPKGIGKLYPKDPLIGDCPFGQVGDRLWVRETCIIAPPHFSDSGNTVDNDNQKRMVQYLASHPDSECAEKDFGLKITPSIHMPRWASRLTLEITDIRVQRIQDISEEDAKAEGSFLDRCPCMPRSKDQTPLATMFSQHWCHIHADEFKRLWDSLNAKRGYGWDVNPWVWAITFGRVAA